MADNFVFQSDETTNGSALNINKGCPTFVSSSIQPELNGVVCTNIKVGTGNREDVSVVIKPDEEAGQEESNQTGMAQTKDINKDDLLYAIDDVPPWHLSMLLGMQHYLMMVGGTITIPFLLTPEMCIQQDDPSRGYILCTILFVSSMVTLLQCTFGIRLPIIQGGSFAFLVPTLAILHTNFPRCDSVDWTNTTEPQRTEEWQVRMREVQGAIILSSLFQILIGFTGLIGLMVSLITPLAIAPTVSLVGLALFEVAANKASSHWGISFFTIVLMVLFSQYLKDVFLPIPVYRRGRGLTHVKINIFGMFPVLLSILLSWALCAILTASGALSDDSAARTDKTSQFISDSPWVRVPYPGQWGTPTVSAAGVFGMLAGVLSSIVESVGDYYACARMSGAPPPPRHAMNRGIAIEGFGCFLAGIWGSGNGTTSYSENIGAIGLTKVGSRRVIQYGGVIMLVCAVMGKFGAVFVSIPEPVVGGIFCVMFAMITAVGLSALQHVDLNSSRNLFVLGFPIFMGLALPKWLEANPGALHFESVPQLSQILTILLKTSMFVGGFLGILLDNTIPGTREERGLLQWNSELMKTESLQEDVEDSSQSRPSAVYDLPWGMTYIRKHRCFRFLPASPTFAGWTFKKK